MTADEFTIWLKHHRAAYPGISAWLGRIDKAARGDDDIRATDVLKRWRNVLNDVSLADARAASDAMARGDLEEPRSFDSHAKAIRRAAIGAVSERTIAPEKPRYVNGEQVFNCGLCLDGGLLIVFHPKTMKAARDGLLEESPKYTCGVACTCERGDRWHKPAQGRREKHKTMRFDERIMVPCDYRPTAEDCRRLLEFSPASEGVEFDPDAF